MPARKLGCARVGHVLGGQNSIFLKDYDGHTRVIRCDGYDLIRDVVGYDGRDIYVTLHGHILDLSGTLLSAGVSDNDTVRVHCRLRGQSNNTVVPGQWQRGKCAATRCWPVRRNCYRCGAPRPYNPPTPAPWNAGTNKGRNRGPFGETHCLDPAMCRPRFGKLMLCRLLEGRLVQRWGRHLWPLILLRRLVTCSEGSSFFRQSRLHEDFSKYVKMVLPPSKEERTKEREQLLWGKVQFQNRLRKQDHVDQIVELEAVAAKQRAMLQGLREQLEAVSDEVCALRTLVADPSVPMGTVPEQPPLPPPRAPPPPQTQDLLDIVPTPDQELETFEDEDELEWKPVRRLARLDRRNKWV